MRRDVKIKKIDQVETILDVKQLDQTEWEEMNKPVDPNNINKDISCLGSKFKINIKKSYRK